MKNKIKIEYEIKKILNIFKLNLFSMRVYM